VVGLLLLGWCFCGLFFGVLGVFVVGVAGWGLVCLVVGYGESFFSAWFVMEEVVSKGFHTTTLK
jgi:hypothetical protein